jgi:hypothetical protein
MAEIFDPGALLGTTYALDGGVRVRLRFARASDHALIRALVLRVGDHAEGLELGELVHFDPRRRAVICATALIDGSETLIGVGAIDLDDHSRPETLIADGAYADAVSELLRAALEARASAAGAARAA